MSWVLWSQVNSPEEVPEEAACEGSSAEMAAAEAGSTALAEARSWSGDLAAAEAGSADLAEARSWSGDLAAVEGCSMAAEDEAASQALERLESAGEAACCLNDTFEVQLHTQLHIWWPCLCLCSIVCS